MKRLFTILVTILLIAGLAQADWFYNPFTGKLDYYIGTTPAFGAYFTLTDGTDTHIFKAVQETGLGGRYTIGLDETARTMVICDYDDIDVDFGLAAASHPTLYLKSASNADHLFMYHDDTDAYIKWSDGDLYLQTDEGTNTGVAVHIRPKGTNDDSNLYLWDDDIWELNFGVNSSEAWIATRLRSLDLQRNVVQDVDFWSSIASGNPSINIYGWNTAGGDRESAELTMDDTNDEFLIQAANSANHEGITVSLPEANQAFRVRNGAGIINSVANDGEVNVISQYGTMQTATGDGTTTIDWGIGNHMFFTFGAQNDTLTFTAPANKGKITLIITQDGVGNRTITWPGTVKWPGGVAPTLSTGAADVDIITFFYDGASYFGLFNGDFQ